MRSIFLTLVIPLAAYGCLATKTASESDPTQLGTRQIEVRTLEVPYDVAYQAATQAFFSLGYSIEHSDKASGILTGSRMTGVKEAKQDQQAKTALGALGFVPFVGMAAGLASAIPGREAKALQVTMHLKPAGEMQTQIRFKMLVNGEPIWDQTTISRLWVTTQREAMIEEGPSPQTPQTTNSPLSASPQDSKAIGESESPKTEDQ